MTRTFKPCQGKTACREDDQQCRTCGRSLEEIYATRALIEELARFTQKMQYQNSDVFFDYVMTRAAKKINYMSSPAGNKK